MSTKLDTTSQGPSAGPNQKFSRYRSVRRAAAETQPTWTGESSLDKPANETIARSMSRYHRPRTAPMTNPLTPPMSSAGCPPVPSLPASIQALPTSQSRGLPAVSSPPRPTTTQSAKGHEGNVNVNVNVNVKGNENGSANEKEKDEDDEDTLSPAEKARMREAAMRKLTMAEQPQARQTSHGVLSTGQIKNPREKEKEKEKERGKEREREKEGAMGHSRRASWKERFTPSHRRKESPSRTEHIPTESTQNSINNNTTALTAPGIDAPVSAVNAGERRVLIKCKSSSITLPITPATRVKDVIFSAANCFSERIDPKTAILVESFSSLGLERPLRRYEHVRDVLNSWASDDENALVLSDAPSESASRQLELHSTPNTAPKDAKFYVCHSSRPNKWDKRYVTLRTDGQVVLSKKSDANEAKDFTNVCHLSDFDIYTPTARQLAKKIKPPKKLCFSIKSQQKSTMFLSTENFVRFFATNDSTVAQDFYNAVHSWRSWYLVHVLEVGKKQDDTASGNVSKPMSRDGHISPVHKRHISTESNPYQLGSFKPLIEFGRNADSSAAVIDKPVEENNETSWDIFMRRKKARDQTGAPSSFPVNLPALDTQTDSLSSRDDQSTFSPDSLLGRTYSERQAAQREREAREGNETDPFLSHGLLKNLSPISPDQVSQHTQFTHLSSQQTSRSNTVRSHHRGPDGMSHSRSNSVRQKGKPLVDLTPTYREPPQHSKKGHGVKVDVGVPLVEVATGLEAVPGVPNIPPATTWRREEAASGTVAGRRRTNTVKSQRHPHPHAQLAENYIGSPDGTPFIPNGLVALSANNAPIQLGTGRGIATGDRHATRPLLDLKPQSEFAEGSLLRSIEKL